jgi:hypothetical protein
MNNPDFIKFNNHLQKQRAALAKIVKECKLLQSQYRGVDIVFACESKRNGARIVALVKMENFKKKPNAVKSKGNR